MSSIVTAQNDQSSLFVHAQNLQELRVELSHGQALALSSFLNPKSSQGSISWQAYEESRNEIPSLILAAAASAKDPIEGVGDVALAVLQWQDTIYTVKRSITETRPADYNIQKVTSSFAEVEQAMTRAVAKMVEAPSYYTLFRTLGVVASILAGLGFLLASWLSAQRTHRVINIGLTIGLVAMIGVIITVQLFVARSSELSNADDQANQLSQAQYQTWDCQSLSALSILLPDSPEDFSSSALKLANSVLDQVAGWNDLSDSATAVVGIQEKIAETDNPMELMLNSSVWHDSASAISDIITVIRPSPDSLAEPIWYSITLAGLCAVAVTATVVGINVRTKEYL